MIAIVVLAVLGLSIIIVYNALVRVRNQVENAWNQISVQLKRRHDLIPNLVDTAKQFMRYEKETLTAVITARNKAVSAQGVGETIQTEGVLTQAVGKLFALMENYPDLKSNQNVSLLMEELRATENKIAFSRQFYNDSVMVLNNKIQAFPSNLIASIFNFKVGVYFEIEQSEKEVPNIHLNA
jgi:LemA protein